MRKTLFGVRAVRAAVVVGVRDTGHGGEFGRRQGGGYRQHASRADRRHDGPRHAGVSAIAVGLHARSAGDVKPQAKQHRLGGVDGRATAHAHQQVGTHSPRRCSSGHHVVTRAVRAHGGKGPGMAFTQRLGHLLQGAIAECAQAAP